MVRPNIPIPKNTYLEYSQPKEEETTLEELKGKMISDCKKRIEYHTEVIKNLNIALKQMEKSE